MNFMRIAALLSTIGLFVFAIFNGSTVLVFIDPASVVLVPVVCGLMLVATHGGAVVRGALRDGLAGMFGQLDLAQEPDRARRVAMVANSGMNFSLIAGVVGGLIGLIQMFQSLSDPNAIGPAMAVALLTAFYAAGMVFLLFMPMARHAAIAD